MAQPFAYRWSISEVRHDPCTRLGSVESFSGGFPDISLLRLFFLERMQTSQTFFAHDPRHSICVVQQNKIRRLLEIKNPVSPSCSIQHTLTQYKSDSSGGEPVFCDSPQHTIRVTMPPSRTTNHNFNNFLTLSQPRRYQSMYLNSTWQRDGITKLTCACGRSKA